MDSPKGNSAMNRRQFLRLATVATATPLLATGYALAQTTDLHIDHQRISLPNLPSGLVGKRVAFLTDIHHGPHISLDFIRAAVRTTQILNPDFIVLGGDYISESNKYIGPVFDVLKQLSAPMGVYGVLGNHDHRHGVAEVRQAMKRANITELSNRGVRLQWKGDSLWLGGVDDMWYGQVDINAAMNGQRPNEASILLSHNPDIVERLNDQRIGLVLSGHTHGGQVVLPGLGAPMIPSRYGMKYAHGLVEGPFNRVYVSSGIGVSVVPFRTNCRPEITIIELV
jgi:uncharacterized protein